MCQEKCLKPEVALEQKVLLVNMTSMILDPCKLSFEFHKLEIRFLLLQFFFMNSSQSSSFLFHHPANVSCFEIYRHCFRLRMPYHPVHLDSTQSLHKQDFGLPKLLRFLRSQFLSFQSSRFDPHFRCIPGTKVLRFQCQRPRSHCYCVDSKLWYRSLLQHNAMGYS